MTDTWITTDLPVLRTAVEWIEGSGYDEYPTATDIAEKLGLPVNDVYLSLMRMKDTYLTLAPFFGEPGEAWPDKILPAARAAIGQWPTDGEALIDRIIAGLNDAAEAEPDPEKKSKLRQAAASFGGVVRDVAIGVGTTVLTKGIGLG